MLYCNLPRNVLFLCWAIKRAGGRKCRAAWRGVVRASWLGRRAGASGLVGERAGETGACYTCSRFSMVQRALDVPPPRQPGARTRGCMAGPGRREAGRSGRRWAGWAGWWAGWVDGGDGDEGHCKHSAMVIASSHRPSSP